MSSYIDPQYTRVRADNEFLAILPNVYNPSIPLPLNVTPEETMAMYDTLFRMRAEKEAEKRRKEKDEEERKLYCGSLKQIAPNWLV